MKIYRLFFTSFWMVVAAVILAAAMAISFAYIFIEEPAMEGDTMMELIGRTAEKLKKIQESWTREFYIPVRSPDFPSSAPQAKRLL